MEKDESGRIKVEYSSEVPSGSGLGTSGALNVGLIATILGHNNSPEKIAEMAFQFESILENKGGRQDQWASAHGGFNHLMFIGDSVEILPFEPMKSSKNWLKKHLIIADSKIEHNSGELHASIWERYASGDEDVINGLHKIRAAARKMSDGIQRDRRELVVESLRDVCDGVDLMDPSLHEPFRSIINPLVESKSVIAWKALGAGAGGTVGLLCSPISRKSVIENLQKEGWEIIDWDYDEQGMRIVSDK
jgi:D-glycero-alpha-D-manno-heptose-7-phosphate kinase